MNGYNSLMEAVRVGALEGCIYYKKEKKTLHREGSERANERTRDINRLLRPRALQG